MALSFTSFFTWDLNLLDGDSNPSIGDSNRLYKIWIQHQWGIQIHNSKIRILLSDLHPSALFLEMGFEFVTRRFESVSLFLHNSKPRWFESSFNLFTCSSWEIRILYLGTRSCGLQFHFFFHLWFKSLEWRFKSIRLSKPYWNQENPLHKDSNRCFRFFSLHILESGFESFFEWFETACSVWTLWKWDSNPPLRDSNHFLHFRLNYSNFDEML